MRDLSQEEERWLSLGKEEDLRKKLLQLCKFREARYADYLQLKKAGLTSEQLTELDNEIKRISEEVDTLGDEYVVLLNYNREKGW
ncbi:hypothetical protein [Mechercharimyces sp. CAU 1602]|uniref:hypothetical protein n=1 Tax=Mechercharimyces sp. CAU 1602 TaxID=2973933 RepID=UPI002162EDC2|nr:hypothetical protein [Mechercharimyces sp. CAU 1602]MCS1350362.1 hypothetical protein [Mechercharimyces sp. CAU 1602]